MSNPPSRELRDALAEALWRIKTSVWGASHCWADEPAVCVGKYQREAEAILAALPEITDPSTGLKLTIGWGG